MRVSKRRALTLSALAGAALLWSGCEAKKQTEYVTGISTQVQVPRDLRSIRVDVAVGGVNVFCRAYKVYDGRVQLPRSLGQLPQSDARSGEPITVTIVGFTEEVSDPSRQNEFDCATQIQAGKNARILRRSRQPYLKDSILFLPMALRFSCFDKDCETPGQDKTCKAGKCVDATTDEKKLPRFSDDLVDGKGGACFNVGNCMGPAAPPVVVNPDDCTYALPNTPSAPPVADGAPPNPFLKSGDGVNVRVVYDGGYNAEILDLDPDEGFTIPDPAKPQQFRLAAGLCEMVKGYADDGSPVAHRITGVFASGVCQAKTPFQPLCEKDMLAAMGADPTGVSKSALVTAACNPTPLKPPPAAVLLLSDTTPHSKNLANEGVSLDIPLSDPAFEKTDVGLMFYPGPAACNGSTTTFPMIVPPKNARTVKQQVLQSFTDEYSALFQQDSNDFSAKSDLDGALASAYNFLRTTYPNAYRRVVFVIGNHDLGVATCGTDTPAVAAQKAFADPTSVQTFMLMVTGDKDPAAASKPDPVGDAEGIAKAGSGDKNDVYDARLKANAARGQAAFRDLVNEIATCVYDSATPLDAKQKLSYIDPVAGNTTVIDHDDACTDPKASANGWGTDAKGHVIICGLGDGQACKSYRDTVAKGAAYALLYAKPALAVPVFAHTPECAPEPGGTPSGVPLPKP